MFTTRLISGIILVAIAIVVVGQGGALLFAVTAAISLVGLFELYRVLDIHKKPLAFIGYGTAVSYYGILWFEGQQYITLMIIASLMLLMAVYVFTFPKYRTEEITGAFFGVCYVPVMLSFLYQTRVMDDGAFLVWLIFSTVFGGHMAQIENPQLACTLACAIAAVISQVGDLAASAVKRNHNIKDYGHLIPGHGGIMDRFDSMIFTAPAIYFALTFLK